MRERPIQDLIDGLNQLGVEAECTAGSGCPPVTVNAKGLPSGKVSKTTEKTYQDPCRLVTVTLNVEVLTTVKVSTTSDTLKSWSLPMPRACLKAKCAKLLRTHAHAYCTEMICAVEVCSGSFFMIVDVLRAVQVSLLP